MRPQQALAVAPPRLCFTLPSKRADTLAPHVAVASWVKPDVLVSLPLVGLLPKPKFLACIHALQNRSAQAHAGVGQPRVCGPLGEGGRWLAGGAHVPLQPAAMLPMAPMLLSTQLRVMSEVAVVIGVLLGQVLMPPLLVTVGMVGLVAAGLEILGVAMVLAAVLVLVRRLLPPSLPPSAHTATITILALPLLPTCGAPSS